MSTETPDPTRFYERFAANFDREMNSYEVGKRLRLVFDEALSAEQLTNRSLLDAGCGTGRFSQAAVRRGARVTSFDVGAALLSEVAKKCESQRIVGDVQRLPMADRTFDVVISTEVLEHTLEPRRAMHELCRVVAAGGLLVLTTPNKLWYPSIVLANRLRLRPYEGVENWISWRQLRDWALEEGFKVVDHRGFNALPFVHPLTYPLIDRLDKFGRRRFGRVMINQMLVARKPVRGTRMHVMPHAQSSATAAWSRIVKSEGNHYAGPTHAAHHHVAECPRGAPRHGDPPSPMRVRSAAWVGYRPSLIHR